MRLFRLIHIVAVYFWDYSGPLLLPLAIMVAIVLLFKWYDRKFLSSKNEKLSPCSEVNEEMVKFINVQQFMDERNNVNSSNVVDNEPHSFTVSASVGGMDRNESYDLSQEALRKEAIVALNSPSEKDEVPGLANDSCSGKQPYILESTNSKTVETHVMKIQLKADENGIRESPVAVYETNMENGVDNCVGIYKKLNSSCNLESEPPGLDKKLCNGFELCTESSVLSCEDHSAVEQYLPPIIITGKSTDLDCPEENNSNSDATTPASSIHAKIDATNGVSSLSGECSAATGTDTSIEDSVLSSSGNLLKSDCDADASKMTTDFAKSTSTDILVNGDLFNSSCEDQNNNKDDSFSEEKEKSSDAEESEDEEVDSSEVDESDDEVISYDLEVLPSDDSTSYTVNLSSQITTLDESTPETSVESTPKHSIQLLTSPCSTESPLKSCLKEASESFLGAEEQAVLTPHRVKFGEIKVTEVAGLGSCAGETSAPQIWNSLLGADDSSSDDN